MVTSWKFLSFHHLSCISRANAFSINFSCVFFFIRDRACRAPSRYKGLRVYLNQRAPDGYLVLITMKTHNNIRLLRCKSSIWRLLAACFFCRHSIASCLSERLLPKFPLWLPINPPKRARSARFTHEILLQFILIQDRIGVVMGTLHGHWVSIECRICKNVVMLQG